jgi:DNA-binding winged helix-turn-helix (wHTH) protein/Flp pilus assembly protein TadD
VTETEDAPRRARFDRFELDLSSGELWRDGLPVELPPQPARVLTILAQRAGRLVGRDELRRRVWGDTHREWETGLHQAIRRIRAALGESASAPRFVETLPRRGYRFRGRVEVVPSPVAGPQATRGSSVLSGGRWGWLLAAAGLLALVGGAGWIVGQGGARSSRGAGGAGVEPVAAGSEPGERLYREGIYFLGRGQLDAAEDRFRRAASLAPEWAPPWSGLAEVALSRPGDDRVPRARAAIERALTRDPDDGRSWRQLAQLRLWEAWDWTGARGALEHALAVEPESADTWQLLAALETVLDREEPAMTAAYRALRIDPVATSRRVDLGWTLYYFGHGERALTECRRSLELEPDNPSARQCVLQSLVLTGRGDEAQALFESSSGHQGDPLSESLRLQIEAAGSGPSCATPAAATIPRLLLGDVSGALDALAEGAEAGRGWEVPFARVDPLLEPWRSDPRYIEVAERLGT